MQRDQFDVSLEDTELLVEVDLVAESMAATSQSPGALTQEHIDAILQLQPRRAG